MFQLIKYLLKNIGFWLLVFLLMRITFVIYNLTLFSLVPITDILLIPFKAIPLDISTMCYIFAFPLLLLYLFLIFSKNWIIKISHYYQYLVLLIYIIIAIAETAIYPEWQSKLNYKAIAYLSHPNEIFQSISLIHFIALVILIGIFQFFFIVLHRFFIKYTPQSYQIHWYYKVIVIIILTPLLFLGIRGGFSEIPINQSSVYYSKYDVVNQTAVNPAWNLIKSYTENKLFLNKNPFSYMPAETANNIVEQIHYTAKDTTQTIIRNTRPNIVLVILESWSADLIEPLGGDIGITPYFTKLCKEGILFSNCYSSGNRSQQGLASIFSGFPAIPITAITYEYAKFSKLPCFNKQLKKEGYYSSFFFGGQLNYGNIKSYIMFNEFDKIMEESDFPSKIPRGRLGIHDEFVFEYMLNDIDTYQEPFLTSIFTLSTHSPYDMPMNKKYKFAESYNDYLNSAYYTDQVIKDFMEKAKQKSWFKNTLFIFIADHSHVSHKNWGLKSFEYHKIPLLFVGNVLIDSLKGKIISTYATQSDLPSTILKQLKLSTASYCWSKNLFNPYSPNFAYFELNDGFGWKKPCGEIIYNVHTQSVEYASPENYCLDSLINEGKAYQQKVFQQYLDF